MAKVTAFEARGVDDSNANTLAAAYVEGLQKGGARVVTEEQMALATDGAYEPRRSKRGHRSGKGHRRRDYPEDAGGAAVRDMDSSSAPTKGRRAVDLAIARAKAKAEDTQYVDLSDASEKLTRVVHISMTATPDELAANGGNVWRMAAEQANALFDPMAQTVLDPKTNVQKNFDGAKVSQAFVSKVVVLKSSNTFDLNVGVETSLQKSHTAGTRHTGNMFDFSIYANANSNDGTTVYDATADASNKLLRKYGGMTMENVYKEKVNPFGTRGYSYLEIDDNILFDALSNNPQRYSTFDITTAPLINDGEKVDAFILVPTKVVQDVMRDVQREVFSRFEYNDLTQFSATFTRADGNKWNDSNGTFLQNASEQEKAKFRSTPGRISADVEITYGLPRTVSGSSV